jgi:hypothetical protein
MLLSDNFTSSGKITAAEYSDIVTGAIKDAENELDILTIAGETFDTIYRLDELQPRIALDFFTNLCELAEMKKFIICVVKGTATHEGNQLETLKFLESKYPIVFYTSIAMINYGGVKIRFVPDLAWDSYDEFLKAFNQFGPADINIIHGLVENAIPVVKEIVNRKAEIIIKIKDILESTRIFTVMGHVHERKRVHPNIWYTGSFSTSSFKDSGSFDHGFDVIEIIPESGMYNVTFIKNTMCDRYITHDISELIRTRSMSEMRAFMLSLKKGKALNDKIRITCDTSDLDSDRFTILYEMKTQFGKEFRIDINTTYSSKAMVDDTNVDAEGLYVMNKNIPLEEKIQREVSLSFKTLDRKIVNRLDKERIRSILNDDISEIL